MVKTDRVVLEKKSANAQPQMKNNNKRSSDKYADLKRITCNNMQVAENEEAQWGIIPEQLLLSPFVIGLGPFVGQD